MKGEQYATICAILTSIVIVGILLLFGGETIGALMSYTLTGELWMIAAGMKVLAFQLTMLAGWRRLWFPHTRLSPITWGLLLYSIVAAGAFTAYIGPEFQTTVSSMVFHGAVIVLALGLLKHPTECCSPS
jgi:hypothetical protein